MMSIAPWRMCSAMRKADSLLALNIDHSLRLNFINLKGNSMFNKTLVLACLFLFAVSVEAKTYGTDMPKGKAVDIAAAAANISNFSGKSAKFSGRITEVCQMKGCWLMIESNGTAARIKTNDKFFVPKNSKGKAVVFGELKQVVLKPEMAKHLAEDAGKTEPVASDEIQIVATSVTIK